MFLQAGILAYIFGINTLGVVGVSSNPIGSVSLANEHISLPTVHME